MRHRRLGKTGYKVSDVGFDTGCLSRATSAGQAAHVLRSASEAGITFYDVSADLDAPFDVGTLLRDFRADWGDEATFAVRVGAGTASEDYTPEAVGKWIADARDLLGVDRLDLVQLESPPTDVYYTPAVFDALSEHQERGDLAAFGVGVERVEEGLKALDYPGLATVSVVLNPFRLRPSERLLHAAMETDVGVIVRDPFAGGFLETDPDAFGVEQTTEGAIDETWSAVRAAAYRDAAERAGIDASVALETAAQIAEWVPEGSTLAQFALRWALTHDEVSTVLAGASDSEGTLEHAAASDLSGFPDEATDTVRWLYHERIAPSVHHRW